MPGNFDARQYLAERLPFVQSDYQIDLWIDQAIEEARRSFALWRVFMERRITARACDAATTTGTSPPPCFSAPDDGLWCTVPSELRERFQALALQAMQAAAKPSA